MTAISSAANGAWATAGTWNGGVKPATGDTVTIGHAITVASSEACSGLVFTAGSLTVQNGGTLEVGGGTFVTTNGSVTIEGGGTITTSVGISGTGALNLAGSSESSLAVLQSNSSSTWRALSFTGASSWQWGNVLYCNVNASTLVISPYYRIWFAGVSASSTATLLALVSLIEESWFSGGGRNGSGGYGYIGEARNVVIGYKRDGSSSAMTSSKTMWITADWPPEFSGGVFNGVPNTLTRSQRAVFNDIGIIPESMCPAVGDDSVKSDLRTAYLAAARGTAVMYSFSGTIERSTIAKNAGEYGMLFTPNANAPSFYLQTSIAIPIVSGDSVAVAGTAKRTGDTSDCADCWIDPEQAWFTTTPTDLALGGTDFESFSASASTAAGTGQEGTCDIAFRMKEYTSGKFLYIADVVVTVTHADSTTTTYTVSCNTWSHGRPVADDPNVDTKAFLNTNKDEMIAANDSIQAKYGCDDGTAAGGGGGGPLIGGRLVQ